METESAVTKNRWTNANGNSGSNSFSSKTESVKKRRTDKAQRSSFPSSGSVTDTEESEDVSSLASEGSTENPSNSQEKADEHERQEKKRKRRSADSSASSASPEATSINSENVCLQQLECGDQTFTQGTCCKMSDSVHEKVKEYATRIVNQNICFPPADIVCEVKPKYSSMTNSSQLDLKDLIGSCFYEYDLQCRNGLKTWDIKYNSYIDASCFCKHTWSQKKNISDSSTSADLTKAQCAADINCLCELHITPREAELFPQWYEQMRDIDNTILRYQNSITQMSCKSSKLEKDHFIADCIMDNTKDHTEDFVTMSGVTRLTEHISNEDTISGLPPFNDTFCFDLPIEWYGLPADDEVQELTDQPSARNLSEVLISASNSNALTIAGVASIATFSILFFGVMFFLVILMFYKVSYLFLN